MQSDKAIRPNHYGRWKIEPIEFIRANKIDALRANVIKYIMRYDAKDGIRDLNKAKQYLDWIIEDWLKEQNMDSINKQLSQFNPICNELKQAEKALYERPKNPDYEKIPW